MSPPETSYHRLTPDHCAGVAAVHAECFPGQFLTLLGPRALERFYRWFAAHDALGWVAIKDGRVVGFVSGWFPASTWFPALVRELRGVFLLGAARGILRSPVRMLGHLWRRRSVVSRAAHPGAADPRLDDDRRERASLESIAVAARARGAGIPDELIRRFVREAHDRGARRIRLSVHADNLSARRLYERTGWTLDAELREGGIDVAKYVFTLSDRADA